MLHGLIVVGALTVIVLILADAFETIVLTGRVTRRVRLSRLFLRYSWQLFRFGARHLPTRTDREGSSMRDRFLRLFGPLALLALLGLWAGALVISFALLFWGFDTRVTPLASSPALGEVLYLSGVTFFTLGYGDVVPLTGIGRAIAVAEVATGFSFLALIIGYLPGIFQAFSRREVEILLLDARAGSPPSATELLRRYAQFHDSAALEQWLRDWERWSAEFLDSHLAYPFLTLFRSQHDHLSWLAALTVIMDVCTLLMVGVDTRRGRVSSRQARLTFAMARHAVGDLCQVLYVPPQVPAAERLTAPRLAEVRSVLAAAGLELADGPAAEHWLRELCRMYQPYVAALADRLLIPLPSWLPTTGADDWQTTAWEWDAAVLPPVDGGAASEGARGDDIPPPQPRPARPTA